MVSKGRCNLGVLSCLIDLLPSPEIAATILSTCFCVLIWRKRPHAYDGVAFLYGTYTYTMVLMLSGSLIFISFVITSLILCAWKFSKKSKEPQFWVFFFNSKKFTINQNNRQPTLHTHPQFFLWKLKERLVHQQH